MARKYKKDIKVVLPHIDPFRDIAVYGAGEEMIKAMGGVVHAGIKKPAIVPTSNNPYFKKYGDGGKKKLDTSVNPTKQSPVELHQEIYRKANYTPYVPTPEELYSKASGRLEQAPIQPEDLLMLGLSAKNLFKANTLLNKANKPNIIKGINIGTRPKTVARAQQAFNKAKGQALAEGTTQALDYAYGGFKRKYADGGVEEKEIPINAANPTWLKEVTIRPEEETPEDTYTNYFLNKNKDASLAEAMFVAPIDYLASYPQAAMMKGLTGKYGEPSDKIGYENPEGFLQNAWNFGVNAIADPTNIGGVGLIDDVAKMGLKGAAKNSVKNIGSSIKNTGNTVKNIGKSINKGLYSAGDFVDRNVNNIQAAITGDYRNAIKQRGIGLSVFNKPSLDEGKLAFEQRKADKLAFWETPEGNQRLAEHLKRNNSPLSTEDFKRDFKDKVKYSENIKERRNLRENLINDYRFIESKKQDLSNKMQGIFDKITRGNEIINDPDIPYAVKAQTYENIKDLNKDWTVLYDEMDANQRLIPDIQEAISENNLPVNNAFQWRDDIFLGEDYSHPATINKTMEHELSGHMVDMKSQKANYQPKINNTAITENLLDNVDLELADMPNHIQELFKKRWNKKEQKEFLKSMTKENYTPEYQQFLETPVDYFQGARKYWQEGANNQNNEPTAFLAEARDYLLKKGHTKTLEEPITEDILEKAFTEYRKDRNMKGLYRLFDIVNPTKKSLQTLTKEINALPSWVAPVVGTTAVGTLIDQVPEQSPAIYSYGGYYKKYK